MIRLDVWLTAADAKTVQVGELIVADPDSQGRLVGQFRYHPDYVDDPLAIALDPVHLPLGPDLFDALRPGSGVHGVFEDSLPDAWGRALMVRKFALGRGEQRVPHLLQLLGGDGLGALAYSTGEDLSCASGGLGEGQLAQLQRQAMQFDRDPTTVDEEIAILFQAGSSPGGARPKALVRAYGKSYIAKFGSVRDQFNVVALESATMKLAEVAGVRRAATRHIMCGEKDVLLVERFDVNPLGGRNHVISMQTLLRADGYYSAAYRDMAQVVRQVSTDPGEDLLHLLRQLVFNVMIGNTDDHLKNFCMINDGTGFRLSPAFDLLPNIGSNREHVLSVSFSFLPPSRSALLEEAKHFGIKRLHRAEELIDSMLECVAGWQSIFREFNVPDQDIRILEHDIGPRLKRLQQDS